MPLSRAAGIVGNRLGFFALGRFAAHQESTAKITEQPHLTADDAAMGAGIIIETRCIGIWIGYVLDQPLKPAVERPLIS